MNCARCQDLLSDYLDGELSAPEASAAADHLSLCGSCQQRFRALRRTVRFVRSHAPVDLPPDSPVAGFHRFLAAIMREDSSPHEVMATLDEETRRYLGSAGPAEGGDP